MNLISELLRGKWLISQEEAYNYLPIIQSVLEGDDFARSLKDYADEQQHQTYALGPGEVRVNRYTRLENAQTNSVAVMPIKGVMTKYNQLSGMDGTDQMAANLKEINENDNVVGTVLELDTPGGSAGGIDPFAQVIANSTKPVVAYINEYAMSGGLWVYSQADYAVASGRNAKVGSLGVMITLRDISDALQKAGVKQVNVRATDSSEKNEAFFQALNGDPQKLREEDLDPLRENFVDAVKEGIGSKLSADTPGSFWQGATFYAEQALSFGLIDAIGNFETAVAKVRELAGASAPSTKSFRI